MILLYLIDMEYLKYHYLFIVYKYKLNMVNRKASKMNRIETVRKILFIEIANINLVIR